MKHLMITMLMALGFGNPAWLSANCGGLADCQEAETGAETSPIIDTGSGGSRNIYTSTSEAGSKTFTITISACGRYKLETRVKGESGNENSFYVQIKTSGGANVNDTAGQGNDIFDTDSTNNWVAQYVMGRNGGGGDRQWNLVAGTYQVIFSGREVNTHLDWYRQVWVTGWCTATATPGTAFTPSVTPTRTQTPSSGLLGAYYALDGTTFLPTGNTLVARTDGPINFDWSTISPDPLVPVDDFFVRWTGCVLIPTGGSGVWTFYVDSDDGTSLWINNVKIIGQWVLQGATQSSGTTTALTAGTWVPIKLEYFDHTGQAQCMLSWSGPGVGTKTLIPSANLGSCPSSGTGTPTPTQISGSPTSTPNGAGTATKTFTPNHSNTLTKTPSPSMSPTPRPPVYQGLSHTARLYGLEYIPFPVNSMGSSRFYELYDPFTTAATNQRPKNTARWRITFKNLSTTVSASYIKIETRVGAKGVSCSSGVLSDPFDAGSGTYSIKVFEPACNYSSTYFWWGDATVPFTERIDAMGDPRYTPYKDELAPDDATTTPSQAFAYGYNWFFRNVLNTDTTNYPDYEADYAPFLVKADNDGYPSGLTTVDFPKLHRLLREGVMQSRSIYNSVAGWSSYYGGLGGEIGGDSANRLSTGVPMIQSAWGGTGSSGRNEITSLRTLVRNTGGTWREMPWLGELWPDTAYAAQWKNTGGTGWGNLANNQSSGSWYRARYTDCDVDAEWRLTNDSGTILAERGCGTAMNGSGNGTDSYNHLSDDANFGDLMEEGAKMGNSYKMPMPGQFGARRPFGLTRGNSQPEWNEPSYRNSRSTLAYYSSQRDMTSASANIGLYEYGTGTRSSAIVRASQANSDLEDTSKPRVGFFVMNGFTDQSLAGTSFIARFSILSCLRAFHEAGVDRTTASLYPNRIPATSGGNSVRVEQVPWVAITEPDLALASNLTGYSTITVKWDMKWVRWDSDTNNLVPYAESYPADFSSTESVRFVCKYSEDSQGTRWRLANTGEAVDKGQWVESAAQTAQNIIWDLSSIPKGTHKFRIEAYRDHYKQHYAYHQMSMYLNATGN
jgi:hypothetical protein